MSVFIFTSLNRITIPSKWQIIPLSLTWLIHLYNFAQDIPFLIPAWPHLCCQASSWTLKAKSQCFLTFLWQKERNFYLLSQQIPARFALLPVTSLSQLLLWFISVLVTRMILSSSLLRHQTCWHRRHQLNKKTTKNKLLLF